MLARIVFFGLLTVSGLRCNASERPNIVFLLTDDQRADTLSSEMIQTPNLDRLASKGVLFENAFVTNPICQPSRTSYFISQYEREHGIGFTSKNTLSREQWQQSYSSVLRESGYFTGFIGKFGLLRYKFDAKEEFDFWRAHDGWASFWAKGNGRDQKPYNLAEADIITPIMSEFTAAFLKARDKSKPFCLSVSYSAPHGSISSSMHKEKDGKGRDRMKYAANDYGPLQGHPVYDTLYRNSAWELPATYTTEYSEYLPTEVHDPRKGRLQTYSYNFEKSTCLEHMVRYAQLVHGIDESVGKLLELLETEGLAENTIIVFSSDHGLFLGDYGIGGKALLYDLATRVPLIVYDPRLDNSKQGLRIKRSVTNLDIAPTLLSLAGVTSPSSYAGRDLRALVDARDPATVEWDDKVFMESLWTGRDGPYCEALRTPKWKYIRFYRHQLEERLPARYKEVVDFDGIEPIYEQLFDLESDSGETLNLADALDHADVLEKLRLECRRLSNDLVAKSKQGRE